MDEKLKTKAPNKKPGIKLLPCICGCKRRGFWGDVTNNTHWLKCYKCGFEGDRAGTIAAVKMAWNDAIKRSMIYKGDENGKRDS